MVLLVLICLFIQSLNAEDYYAEFAEKYVLPVVRNMSFDDIDRSEFDPYIFDPTDIKMKKTYKGLFNIYLDHLMNDAKENNGLLSAIFNENLYYRAIKLMAAFLKYTTYNGNQSFSNIANKSGASNVTSSEESKVLLQNMVQYYRKLTDEGKQFSVNVTEILKRHMSLRTRLRYQTKLLWNRGTVKFESWLHKIKIPYLYLKNKIQKAKQMGAKIIRFFLRIILRIRIKPLIETSTTKNIDPYQKNFTFYGRHLLRDGAPRSQNFNKVSMN